jgi:hypothetical protein
MLGAGADAGNTEKLEQLGERAVAMAARWLARSLARGMAEKVDSPVERYKGVGWSPCAFVSREKPSPIYHHGGNRLQEQQMPRRWNIRRGQR